MTPAPAMLAAGKRALLDARWMLTRRSIDQNSPAALAYVVERVWLAMEAANIERQP